MNKLWKLGTLGIAILGLILLFTSFRPGSNIYADSKKKSKRAVIMQCTTNFTSPKGTNVITYDGSPGSPTIASGISCADALAILFKDGFIIGEVDEGDDAVQFLTYLLVDSPGSTVGEDN